MNDHFDRRVSDQEFLCFAASTWDVLDLSAVHDPGLAVAVHVLEDFLSAARSDLLPVELYGNLRLSLAEREQPL